MLSFFGHLIEQEIILENKIEFLAKQHKIPVEHVEKLAAADPNPKKKNLMWLVRQHKSNAISLDMHDGLHPDEIHQHSQALRRLEDFHTKEPGEARKFFGDINQYKTVHDLNAKMDDYEENHLKAVFDKNWGEKVFDHEGHQIYHASDELQASNHGNNTGWCTRIHGGNHQTQYLESGNLYVHYPPKAVKPGEKDHESDSEGRHQFFIPEDDSKPELQNHRNNPVHPIFHEANHPSLEKSEHWNKFKNAFENHHNEEHDEDYEDDPYDEMHRLAHSGNHDDRIAAVDEHDAHLEFGHLWQDQHADVRMAILNKEHARGGNPATHAHNYYKDDTDDEIKGEVAHKATHPDILDHMIKNHSEIEQVRDGLFKNPATPHDFLHHVAKHGHEEYTERANMDERHKIARNPKSSQHPNNPGYDSTIHHAILDHEMNHRGTYNAIAQSVQDSSRGDHTLIDRMASHSDPDARATAARFNPEKYFDKLKDDESPAVHKELAIHYPERYLDHGDPSVKSAAIRNISDDHPGLYKLTDHPNNAIRKQVALKIGPEGHIKMMNDHDHDVVNRIGNSILIGNHSEDHLAKLADSSHAQIRAAVALKTKNFQTYSKLYHGGSDYVRNKAEINWEMHRKLYDSNR